MHRKILTIALAAFALAFATSPAFAAKAPHRYSPKHGAKCHKAYKRVVKHTRHHRRKVFCVKRAAKQQRKLAPKAVAPTPASPTPSAAAPEKTKLHSHLDPEYTQNPLNPFEVTYQYSASATQEVQGFAVEEAAPLPSGVLSLYSDGMLECAINVGSGVEGSECPVMYKRLGEHKVTTIYTSGEESATETEIENIEPLPSSVSLTAHYEVLWVGAGLLTVRGTPSALPVSYSLRFSIPGEPGSGTYWRSESVVAAQPIELGAYCEGDQMWLGVPHSQFPKEPISFFDGRTVVAEFSAAGYQGSSAEIPLPAFTSCLSGEG